LKAKASLELNRCHIAGGQLELAYEGLTETLVFVDHGHLAGEVAFELADVCLKLGRNSQAVSVCLQLLNLGPPQRIKQKTLNVLAAAYKRQKNYDRAAAALLGKWDKL
jgi:tetratricopeptide (TPR) repeat protein